MTPAAGQGALGIEIRRGDTATRQLLAFLDDAAARATTTCERALLNKLGGGCQVPIGAFAEIKSGKIHLNALVAHPDGSKVLREMRAGNDPTAPGRRGWRNSFAARRRPDSGRGVRARVCIAATTVEQVSGLRSDARRDNWDFTDKFWLLRGNRRRLRAAGFLRAASFMPKANENYPLRGTRILVGRARHQAGSLSSSLRALGASVIEIPFIEIRKPKSFAPMDQALKRLATYDWLILTSANGVEAMWERLRKLRITRRKLSHLRIAAIGPATKRAIVKHGLKVKMMPEEYVAESVVKGLRGQVNGKRVSAGAGQSGARCDSRIVARGGSAGGCCRGVRDDRAGEIESAVAGADERQEAAAARGDVYQFVDRSEFCRASRPSENVRSSRVSSLRRSVRSLPRHWANWSCRWRSRRANSRWVD